MNVCVIRHEVSVSSVLLIRFNEFPKQNKGQEYYAPDKKEHREDNRMSLNRVFYFHIASISHISYPYLIKIRMFLLLSFYTDPLRYVLMGDK